MYSPPRKQWYPHGVNSARRRLLKYAYANVLSVPCALSADSTRAPLRGSDSSLALTPEISLCLTRRISSRWRVGCSPPSPSGVWCYDIGEGEVPTCFTGPIIHTIIIRVWLDLRSLDPNRTELAASRGFKHVRLIFHVDWIIIQMSAVQGGHAIHDLACKCVIAFCP